ncbi:MAG TPA: YdeI/OmpD-associated family protein [Gemmatimonadales bacterium]|nr:YdeI/OmpD-associated family protein [Gemmatimonadales bacterium]
MAPATVRSYRAEALRASGRVTIPVPFDPGEMWGPRDRHHVTGTINGVCYRTTLVHGDGSWQIVLGPKSGSGALLQSGQSVEVTMAPEGPQPDKLSPDIADALAARPRAQAAFAGLATFYRKGWLRWIDATKRRPEVRAERIAEMVRLVEAGHKERP